MIEAIVKEIKLTAMPKTERISTLYFGGGTPSILNIEDLETIVGALKNQFSFSDDIEITLEANPDDISVSKLAEWKTSGINRLSVGLQSFVDEELKWMNRAHSAQQSVTCIDNIRQAGFTNFSVDLIYGSPLLDDSSWKKNAETVIQMNIPHISCYALTVEPKTALHKMIALHKKEPVDAEKQARHFLLLIDWMEKAGYEHYEISNFSKPGFRSRHNSSYWQGETYYGLGPSAHSFDGKKRKWNISNNVLYIQSLQMDTLPFEEEILTETQRLNEYIMTSLRTMEGLDLDHVAVTFGENKKNKLHLESRKFESTGKTKIENNRVILTKEGKLFADGIAADLFF